MPISGRKLRDPDEYWSAIECAEDLRDIANRLEAKGGMVRFSLQLSFATEQEVEEAYRRRTTREVKNRTKP